MGKQKSNTTKLQKLVYKKKNVKINTGKVRTSYNATLAMVDELKIDISYWQRQKLHTSKTIYIKNQQEHVKLYGKPQNVELLNHFIIYKVVILYFINFLIYNDYILPNVQKRNSKIIFIR